MLSYLGYTMKEHNANAVKIMNVQQSLAKLNFVAPLNVLRELTTKWVIDCSFFSEQENNQIVLGKWL